MAQPSRAKGRKRGAGSDASAVSSARKPWGGRFAEATDTLTDAYTSSIEADARLIAYDIIGSIAHARMLGRQRIIAKKDADAIVGGLEEILEEFARGEFTLHPDLEDVHMNVESRLAAKIGPVAGKLHTARSRNDQVATDFRMYVKDACKQACIALLELQSSLLDLAGANKDAPMPGYTHLQRAQPVLFAHHLLAYVQMFARDFMRFNFAHVLADSMPLGSGALAGVPYDIDRASVAEELGFAGISENSIDAVSDRDFVHDYVSAAALAMVHVSRLAEELILWSSAEFAFIRLPDAFATGSSIMPQKKNPDIAELARGRTARVIGGATAVLTMLKGLPLSYNRDLQEDKPLLFDAEDTLLSTLHVLAVMLPHIQINADRMKAAAAANFSLATDLADDLVRKGLPFREAHEAVGKLVRHAESRGVELHDLSLAEMRHFSPLFNEDSRGIDVMASLRSRDVPGGTAPKQVSAALKRSRKRVDALLIELKEDGSGSRRSKPTKSKK